MTAPGRAPYEGTALPPHLQPRRRSKVPFVVGGALAALGVVAVLAFGVFGIHTAFIDDTVSEEAPTFASGASAGGTEGGAGTGTDAEGSAAVTTAATGTFEGREHPGEGTVALLTDGSQTFVRFEDDFATDNGPDLYAAVVVDGERVELGELKGNQGSQNYELPADVDPAAIDSVQVWCKRFDVVFTEATVA